MTVLANHLPLSNRKNLPLSSFEYDLFAWRNEIDFIEKEQNFFLLLMTQGRDTDSMDINTETRTFVEKMNEFSSQSLEPFKKQLAENKAAIETDEVCEERIAQKRQHLNKQFLIIKQSFRDFKENTFDRAEDFISITIL